MATTRKTRRPRLGIIQTRGLGDVIIALPIAHHYHHVEGYDIMWPILEEFLPNVAQHVPWIQWIPIPNDRVGRFFYDVPQQRLANLDCDEYLPLYQALTGHRFHEEVYFQYTKFDQYKYLRAGVPLLKKWTLDQCITRDLEEEQRVYQFCAAGNPDYVLVHLEGSDHRAAYDPAIIPPEYRTVEITPEVTPSVFNWITAIDRAAAVIMVDSVMSNLTDQMNLVQTNSRYFIQRSHVGLTPVQGQHWTWLESTANPAE